MNEISVTGPSFQQIYKYVANFLVQANVSSLFDITNLWMQAARNIDWHKLRVVWLLYGSKGRSFCIPAEPLSRIYDRGFVLFAWEECVTIGGGGGEVAESQQGAPTAGGPSLLPSG